MKIQVLSLSYNCVEIIPFFLRHYEQFADNITVWDDNSNDGTYDLLADHPLVTLKPWTGSKGINEDEFLAHWQAEYPKARGVYDWVMIPDTDEFLVPALNFMGMRATLRAATIAGYDVIATSGFNLVGPHFPFDDGRLIHEINPMGVRAPIYSKPIVFRPEIQINWTRGRHALENCSPNVSPPLLKLLHARYFGRDYTAKRNAQNYARAVDKGVAWSCSPNYDGYDAEHEGSPSWAEFARTKAFNVMT